ncbi:hypothetical protein [Blastococcus sp. LR1]|uniref:hypothetical protein n=1 Tax=Blastococcus sp. LR1 TaxID=2877000 RepID=UPI001CCCECA3|nr:hypothetical protein [Blastococcus sp. LR1]MCA0146739.1 hypothetical protein [Blastococcus sp. LR1]
MRQVYAVLSVLLGLAGLIVVAAPPAHAACEYAFCPDTELSDGEVGIHGRDARVGALVGAPAEEQATFAWRLRTPCMLSDEATGACSAVDFRECPQVPGRVIAFYIVQRRPLVQLDGSAVGVDVPQGARPGDLAGNWVSINEPGACLDVTDLNPPPSGAEVFSFFQRLPLPTLTTQHQPPGDGLAGLPVIFYTDSPTAQTFTVDIRGFTVTIEATAQQFTWHTGDTTGQIVTTDPGQPYPDQTIEHDYRSGSYTAYLTVTWGATFTVNGSAPADVPGTTTTDGPPVTFDVLQARTELTDPFD